MTNRFEHILEDYIVDLVAEGNGTKVLLDLMPANGSSLHFSSRILSTIEYPFEEAVANNELRADITPEQLLEWISRIVLTFVQFPRNERELRFLIRTFVLPALKPQSW